jgi:RimJ/RimL family protein N-acetyltransferase
MISIETARVRLRRLQPNGASRLAEYRSHPNVAPVEIGFTLAPEMQGRGLAAEACRAAIEFVFASTGVAAVKAVVDGRNAPAIALVKRLGMSFDHTEEADMHFVLPRRENE